MQTAALVTTKLRARRALRAPLRAVRPASCILTYHRVGTPPADPWHIAVPPETFEQQLRFIASRYAVTTVAELTASLAAGEVARDAVVVTFDDGYADNLTDAAPIAASLGVPIHVFVTAAPVVGGDRFWWDEVAASVLVPRPDLPSTLELDGDRLPLDTEANRLTSYRALRRRLKRAPANVRDDLLARVRAARPPADVDFGRPLTPTEVGELARAPGVTIGAHTMSHACLAELSPDAQEAELGESRRVLEDLSGQRVDTVAYPYGTARDVSPETPDAARRAGFVAAFSTVARPVTGRSARYFLPRLTVHDSPPDVFRRELAALLGR